MSSGFTVSAAVVHRGLQLALLKLSRTSGWTEACKDSTSEGSSPGSLGNFHARVVKKARVWHIICPLCLARDLQHVFPVVTHHLQELVPKLGLCRYNISVNHQNFDVNKQLHYQTRCLRYFILAMES